MYSSIRLNGVIYTKSNLSDFIGTADTSEENTFYTEIINFLVEWFNEDDTVLVHTSGSTGEPKPMYLRKEYMINSAKLTCSFFGLNENSTALLCMPVRYIAGKMMLVRAIVSKFSLAVVVPSSRPLQFISIPFNFIAVVPLQLYTSLDNEIDAQRFDACDTVLVGGGSISSELQQKVKPLSCKVYSSYGMTETVSHIALRKLNGEDCSEYYRTLPNVKLSISDDETLLIDAPLVASSLLKTNDLVEFNSDGEFKVLGRIDNIINSGGVKLQIEKIEEKLQNLFDFPSVITSIEDARLGNVVTLLFASPNNYKPENLREQMREVLSTYELAKYIFNVDKIPLTETKKVDRVACRRLANAIYKNDKK